MKTTKQETRKGTEHLEEEDTYQLLKQLTPKKRVRCRGNTKAVGRACVKAWEPQTVTLDERVGVAVSRAAYYLLTLPERVAEVKKAADEVLLADRQQEGRSQ